MRRAANGQILPGPMDEETKERIRQGLIRSHAERRKQEGPPPDLKWCPGCERWLDAHDDFYQQRRTLKSGEVTRHPMYRCKECESARTRKWREDHLAEVGREAFLEEQKEYNRNRDPENKRRYNREYSRLRRIEAGVPQRGPHRKYRNEPGKIVKQELFAVHHFRRWWEKQSAEVKEFIRKDDQLARHIRKMLSGEQKNVELSTLDHIALHLGDPSIAREITRS